MAKNVQLLALKLLDRFDGHISAQLLLLHHYDHPFWIQYYRGAQGLMGFTGLRVEAFLGIAEIVAALLEMKEWDVNATDCTGSTDLTSAAIT